MYLNARRFLWSVGDHPDGKISEQISAAFPELGTKRIKEVTAEIGYWRKANQIHKWFVDNVQGGTDDCDEYSVSIEQLQALLDTVNKVLDNRKEAKNLLPPSSGFFFGSTDVDQYYYDDLEQTKRMLENILAQDWKSWDIYYRSSW